ncbi:NmrA family NAD(P)-binding protein [Mycobacterium sp. 050134]|uniref:NmrA family NAD(P)-binding protein n=1 Tax=Mycobacterium sp. 050134 TaxID=3096111 RepID=UPI002EDAC140
MSDQNGAILVFGATGRATGTAARVARLLRARGKTVRALVRRDDERAQLLRDNGVEVVFGDFADRRTLVPALKDVVSVQFTHPVAAGVITAAANMVSAIREIGNDPHVVVCSMGTARKADSPSGYGRDQFVADELITTTLRSAVALKFATHFYEMVDVFYGDAIRGTGEFASYHGDAPVPWTAGHDVAEICVRALLDPQLFGAERTPLIPSAELMSHAEVAELISDETSRLVTYHPLSESDWNERLAVLSEHADATTVQHLSAVTKVQREDGDARFRAMAENNPDRLADLLGRPPIRFADFIHEHRADFLGPLTSRRVRA